MMMDLVAYDVRTCTAVVGGVTALALLWWQQTNKRHNNDHKHRNGYISFKGVVQFLSR